MHVKAKPTFFWHKMNHYESLRISTKNVIWKWWPDVVFPFAVKLKADPSLIRRFRFFSSKIYCQIYDIVQYFLISCNQAIFLNALQIFYIEIVSAL